MRNLSRTLAMGVVALAALAAALPAFAQTSVYRPGAQVHGKSLSQWGDAWWTLSYETPGAQNQILDPDGRYGHVGQSGPVFFLWGTFGGPAERWVTIADDVDLFFPLVNSEWDPYPFGDPNAPYLDWSVDLLRQITAGFIDTTNGLSASVDGVPVTQLRYTDGAPVTTLFAHRERTDKPFSYRLPRNNTDVASFFGDPRFTGMVIGPAVSDGYWLMLTPLSVGQHTVRFGSTSTTGFFVDVVYHLNVVKSRGKD